LRLVGLKDSASLGPDWRSIRDLIGKDDMLFRSHCFHRIDVRSAQGGQPHSCKRNGDKQDGRYAESRSVKASKWEWRVLNQMSKCPHDRFGKCKATGKSDGDLPASIEQNRPEDFVAIRAQRHANAEFARALVDCEGENSVAQRSTPWRR